MDTYVYVDFPSLQMQSGQQVHGLSCLVKPLLLILPRYHILFITFNVTQTTAALRNYVRIFGAMNTVCIPVSVLDNY